MLDGRMSHHSRSVLADIVSDVPAHTIKKLQKEILVKDMKFDSAVTYASSLERAAKEQEAMVENRNTYLNKLTNKPKCTKSNTTSDNNSCS